MIRKRWLFGLLLVALGLAVAMHGRRPPPPIRPSAEQQGRQFRTEMASLRGRGSSYLITNPSTTRSDSIWDLEFTLRGDTLILGLAITWFRPNVRIDSVPRWRVGSQVRGLLGSNEVIAAHCAGAGDPMLVYGVAVPTTVDTFQTPRLAWRADTAQQRVVPVPAVGLRCTMPPLFVDDGVVEFGPWDEVRFAFKSWVDDVQMMIDRFKSRRARA